MRPLPSRTSRRFGVFTTAEAVAAGWTSDALRHAVAVGHLERVRTGCYAPPLADGLGRHARADSRLARASVAASLALRGAYVSHLGSSLVYGLPIWAPSPHACVTTFGTHTRVTGVHVHRSADHPGHVGTVDGIAITSPERTVVDVAREFGVEAGLVVADAAVRHAVVDRRRLEIVTAAIGRRADVSAVRTVCSLMDGRAESPLESRSRWQLLTHELPPARPQTDIFTVEGVHVARVDLYWDDGVVGEVDGSVKYVPGAEPGENPGLVAEKWRQERLEDLDLEVVRWGARDLRAFAPTAARVWRAFARAGARSGPRRWIAVPTTVWS